MGSPNAVASLRMPWMYLLISGIVGLRLDLVEIGKSLFSRFPQEYRYTFTSRAMAQMNPESSRAMAVTILFFSFPLARSLRNLPQSLT